jgi:light-regulated signal transduction histidine kinase (bacteriophytochrome)
VIAYTKLLSNRFKGELGSDAGEYIGQTVDAATRMQQLIRDLLAYSRAGKGGDLLAVDCEKPLTSAIDNLRVAIEESGARITKGALPTVRGDEAQLTSLFQNLIGNAIKYRDRQNTTTPKIHVSANRCGEEWKFEVCDNGIGIDPQYSTQIFALFQRLHSRSDYPGVGIGLAICSKIVERHGGRIWVESQLGQGATFYFTLPAR